MPIPPPLGECDVPPAASPLVGWAAVNGNGVATTTGGGNATPITVTTLAELQAAVLGTDPAVIFVRGVMAPGELRPGSNKTIVGLCGAELHGHMEVSGAVNTIIRNIKIVGYGVGDCALDPGFDPAEGCSTGDDAITVQRDSHHIWFDHCDVSDGTDGNLDISNGANFVTISWTKFHYTPRTDNVGSDSTGAAGHRYSNLVGGSDNTTADADALNVTWHHNWWADNVVERQPRIRFGENHLFNNYWSSATTNYAVRSGIQAGVLIENSYFDAVRTPHQFNNDADQMTGNITVRGNVYDNTTGTQITGGGGPAFTNPPYPYTLDLAEAVPDLVQAGAGPK
jgi:pectate lyase